MFTADDLKRLKEYLPEAENDWDAPLTIKELTALLARLKAAERVAIAWNNFDAGTGSRESLDNVFKAWRKAAGKGE